MCGSPGWVAPLAAADTGTVSGAQSEKEIFRFPLKLRWRYPLPMTSELVIRPAKRDDQAVLLALHRSLYIEHREAVLDDAELLATQYRDFEQVLKQDLLALIAREDATVLVAEAAGAIVGYITGSIQEDARRVIGRRGLVEDWLVTPERRDSGVGRRLMESLIDVFRNHGCQLVESSTWVENSGARDAHRSLGFSESQVRFRRWLDED